MFVVIAFLFFLPANGYSKDEDNVFSAKRRALLHSRNNCYSADEDNVFSAKLTAKNGCVEMCLIYPQFGLPEVDKTIQDFAVSYFDKHRDEFMTECPKDQSDSEHVHHWTFHTMWGLATTPGTISLGFYVDAYTGGAHGQHWPEVLIMDPKGKLISHLYMGNLIYETEGLVEDLFDKREGLYEFLSKYAAAALLRDDPVFLKYGIEPSPQGLAPNAENFKYFTVTPNGLYLFFREYHLASYAFTPNSCFVPLEVLAKFEPKLGIWDRVGAISPSFDCAQARTPMDVAICQNSILAKYDADMANEYKRALSEVIYKEELKKEQRQWLKKIRTKCIGTNEDTNICLMVQYQARVKQLKGY
jgi:uncharacterized protein